MSPKSIKERRPELDCGEWCVVWWLSACPFSNLHHFDLNFCCWISQKQLVICSGDCHEEVQSSINASSGAVNVFCFEPNQRNFAQLVLTRDAFFTNNTPDVQW